MTFRLVHASGDQFAPDATRRKMYPAAAKLGDVYTTGEANKDHAAIRALAGFDSTVYQELAIAWRRDKFDLIDKSARLVMVGGKRGPLGSKAKNRRGPNRYALLVVLREKSTGQQWLISTHHSIAKADTSYLWRRPLRSQGFNAYAAFVKSWQAKYPTALDVRTGDWNTKGAVRNAGVLEIPTPATFNGLRYDRIQATPDVRWSGVSKFATVLDHDGLAVNLSALGAIPTPAPTPPEVPVARQARSLDVMLAEINKHAPNRSKASDGGLGDQAHASRASDHNPNDAGVWRARDVTNDAKGGMDGYTLSRLVASKLGKIPALGSGAYVIFNRQIISTNRLSEGWRYYGGTNAHQHHVHVSVATSASGYDSTKAWDLFAPTAPPVPPPNHVETGRKFIKQGLDLIDAGLKELAKADKSRSIVHLRVAAIADANKATRALYSKGPSK